MKKKDTLRRNNGKGSAARLKWRVIEGDGEDLLGICPVDGVALIVPCDFRRRPFIGNRASRRNATEKAEMGHLEAIKEARRPRVLRIVAEKDPPLKAASAYQAGGDYAVKLYR